MVPMVQKLAQENKIWGDVHYEHDLGHPKRLVIHIDGISHVDITTLAGLIN